jgi:arylsulfatase A-like enzyme
MMLRLFSCKIDIFLMFKRIIHTIVFIILVQSVIAQHVPKQPNIVLILADDLGWVDLQCYGSRFYETPNLDRLAAMGTRFNNAYASCPVCSPTRASILTGKYPIKTGITDWIKGRQYNGKGAVYEKLVAQPFNYFLPPAEETIAEAALKNNYKTFVAGKWHLGEEEKNWPETNGFQINKGGFSKGSPAGFKNDTTGGFFTPYNNPRLTDGPRGEYLTNRLTNECISFIEENKNAPFFLMYSLYAVHNPLQAPADLIKKYLAKKQALHVPDSVRFRKDEPWMKFEKGWKQRMVQDNAVYAAMIENMDENIGRILSKIDAMGLSDNTIIVFTSDNGGLSTAEGSPTNNGVLKAGKGWLYEGGIRVPLILKWPGKIKEGQVSEMPVSSVDIFPTLYKAIHKKAVMNKAVDGKDIVELLANEKRNIGRSIFWHYPHYSNQGGKPGAAMVKNGFKLILNYEDKSIELYNLKNDISERYNIASANKNMVKAYKKILEKWLRDNKAKFPISNPAYHPDFIMDATAKSEE